jgi:hypothetical protein
MGTVSELPTYDPQVFWAEMSPCAHVVQIYGDDEVFLDGLEGFVTHGLRAGEAAIVIATDAHLQGLEERMAARGIDVGQARADDRYLALPVEDTLSGFMESDWPDDSRFAAEMGKLLARARGSGERKVRAFGEMVAVLWSQGLHAATIHLELLWSRLCAEQRFRLFCSYPRDTFSKNATESIVEICRIHSRVVPPPA